MKPEEFEVYVIPPNFMEGGTLFGGLLKTRNTIEAVILGLAVGVPVLRLPFSITIRVVILCLTALPLVLLALIGVSGMSLSAFIRLFFCFLHNRRILSRDGTQGGKNGKTLLPSWAQQRKSDCEAEDPPLPKSRSRFSVDLKQRSVTQFKTFLQEEEAVQPLNALADYIPIEKIEHGVIYTRDHRYVKVVEVVPVNFLLRSAREQRSIIYSFISYLKIAPVKVQFKALTKRADINRHLDTVRRELEHEQDPRCRVLQEDYLKLIRQIGSREAITRRFFLVFEYEPLPGTKRGHEEEDAIASLQTAARTAANYLRQCGNEVISPENEDDATAEILYNILCRRASSEPFYQRVKSVLADYMASGRDINAIPVNEFYAPDSIDLKTVYVSPGKTVEIEWENTAVTGQIQIYKYAAEYNEVTGTAAGTPLKGAVYEIVNARSGKVVDYITTDARGVAASKPLPLTRYQIREVTAPAYWQLDPTVHDVTLEYPGQIIKLSAYDKPASLGVTITKRGNAQVMAGQSMRYDLTVANTSNVPLESFFWHDKIPYDVARPTTLTTGTYSARLNYRILYKTNCNTSYQVLASNLLTSNNYSFSLNAIPMQAGEVVTDIYFDFGKVPVGFQSVVNPTLSVMVNGNAVNGYQMVNRADVGGKYQGTWQTATASWVTIIRRLWNTPTLPKTGY